MASVNPFDPWAFTKSVILVVLSAFFIGCAWGACRLGVALVESLVPR